VRERSYIRAVLGNGGAEVLNDAGVDVEEVVPGHAGLPRHAGRDDHDVRPLQRLPELVIPHEPLHLGRGVDVGDVGGDAGGAGDIVEGEGGDERVQLHEEGERLPDAAGRAEDGDLPLRLAGGGGVAAAAAEDLRGGSHQRRPHCCSPLRRSRSDSVEEAKGGEREENAKRCDFVVEQRGCGWDWDLLQKVVSEMVLLTCAVFLLVSI
jgi:hypothetical protein